jgi:hypothetical protein
MTTKRRVQIISDNGTLKIYTLPEGEEIHGVPMQIHGVKTCRDCPLLVEVSGNVLHELTGKNTYEGGQLYLCADDGEWADPDLVPGHECTLYEEGPMLASLETPR